MLSQLDNIYILGSLEEAIQATKDFMSFHTTINDFTFQRGFKDGSRVVLSTSSGIIEHSFVLNNKTKRLCLPDLDLPEFIFFNNAVNTHLNSLECTYRKEMNMLKKKFKITKELIYIKQYEEYADHFSFYTGADECVASNFFLNNLLIIKEFSNGLNVAIQNMMRNNRLINSQPEMMQSIEKRHSKQIMINSGIVRLTSRESEVFELMKTGKSAKLIAAMMDISRKTVEFHINNLKNKTKSRTKLELLGKLIL